MPTTVKAYAAKDAKSDPVPTTIERRDLRSDDVGIDVLYCGICHSDLHISHNDWGVTKYPFVGGHEIIGKVREVGKDVKNFKVGDLVGVGCLVNSCKSCSNCDIGKENWCAGKVGTYNSDDVDGTVTKGGYSQSLVVRDEFVVKVPSSLDPAGAAPLLCAGITTYSPLKAYGCGPGKKVAVVGLGGLGAMAVKLAHAMGAEVTLFSRSHAKDASAAELGAKHVVASTKKTEVDAVAGKFDIIIDTVPFEHDLNLYLLTLAPAGILVIVGQIGPISMHSRIVMMTNRLVTASNIGGIPETQEMLDFCGEHNITCEHELIKYDYISEAYKRVHNGDVKYRFVLDASSL